MLIYNVYTDITESKCIFKLGITIQQSSTSPCANW